MPPASTRVDLHAGAQEEHADHREHHAARRDAEAAESHDPRRLRRAGLGEVEVLLRLVGEGAIHLIRRVPQHAEPDADDERAAERHVEQSRGPVTRRLALRAAVVAVQRAQRLYAEHAVGDAARGLRAAHDELRRLVALPLGVGGGRDQSPQHVADQPDADRDEGDRPHRPVADHADRAARVGRRAARPDRRPRGERADDDVHDALGGIAGAAEHDQRRRRGPKALLNVRLRLDCRHRGPGNGWSANLLRQQACPERR